MPVALQVRTFAEPNKCNILQISKSFVFQLHPLIAALSLLSCSRGYRSHYGQQRQGDKRGARNFGNYHL
jgi:hypothetical protein